MILEALEQWVARPLKQAAHTAWQRQRLRRAMRHVLALPTGVAPERPLLAELRAAWGNDRCAADLDFLSEVARLAVLRVTAFFFSVSPCLRGRFTFLSSLINANPR